MTLSGTLYHLTLVGEHLGQRTQNGFYFTDKTNTLQDNSAEALTALMNRFNDLIIPLWAQFCSSSWHGLGLIGQVLNTEPKWIIESGYATLTGVQNAESLPSDNAAVISLGCGVVGRSSRGRIYVPGISKDSADGNFLNGSSITALRNLADGLAGNFALAGSSLDFLYTVYSKKKGVIRHPGPPPFLEFTTDGISLIETCLPRTLICSMRRRRPDHGI
jgi:hypothetical protein